MALKTLQTKDLKTVDRQQSYVKTAIDGLQGKAIVNGVLLEGVELTGEDVEWTNYSPTVSASGAMTASTPTLIYARYRRAGNEVTLAVSFITTLGGVASTNVYVSLPVTAETNGAASVMAGHGYASGNGLSCFTDTANENRLYVQKDSGTNFTLAATTFYITAHYEVAASTVVNDIAHGLDREPRGYLITTQTDLGVVSAEESPIPERFLRLKSTKTMTVDVWVF